MRNSTAKYNTGEAHDSAEEGKDNRDKRHKMQSVKPDEIKTKWRRIQWREKSLNRLVESKTNKDIKLKL